jgi:hypothetical protein
MALARSMPSGESMLRITSLLLLGVLGAGCADDTESDCFGSLVVTVPLTSVPAKVQIIWQGNSVLNECTGEALFVQYFEKETDRIVLERGGLGFYVPSKLSIKIRDLGDCSQLPVMLYDVEDQPVAERATCTEDFVTFPAM